MPLSTHQNRLIGASLPYRRLLHWSGHAGLPILSGLAGFQPSVAMFILSWLFMMATGCSLR